MRHSQHALAGSVRLLAALLTALLVSAGAAGAFAASSQEERFNLAADYSEQNGGRSILVMVEGKIVFERYANGAGNQMANILASGTKSFVGVVAMAAVEDGLLRLGAVKRDGSKY